MITGDISNNKNQILLQNNRYFNSALEIISKTNFTSIDDGKFELEADDFFYFLITYKTKGNINEAAAESHRKYIDFHYIIYGEEVMGYAGSVDSKLITADYNEEKDVELFNCISGENFFILRKDMFVLFYPFEIHRPGLSSKEMRSVRKMVFKIKVKY